MHKQKVIITSEQAIRLRKLIVNTGLSEFVPLLVAFEEAFTYEDAEGRTISITISEPVEEVTE